MTRRADPPIAGVPVASWSPVTGFEPCAFADRPLPPPFQRFPDAGPSRTGAHPVQGSAQP